MISNIYLIEAIILIKGPLYMLSKIFNILLFINNFIFDENNSFKKIYINKKSLLYIQLKSVYYYMCYIITHSPQFVDSLLFCLTTIFSTFCFFSLIISLA